MYIDLTEKANEELAKVVEAKKTDSPFRIYIAGYG